MKDITKSVVRNYYQPQRLEGKYNSANYKREIVQRIWNYNLEENEDACTSFENLRNPAHHKIRLYKAKGFWKPRPSEAKVKDEQIDFLGEQIKPVVWYESGEFWFAMGVVGGILITIGAGYALGQTNR